MVHTQEGYRANKIKNFILLHSCLFYMRGLSFNNLNQMRELNYRELNRNKDITNQRKKSSEGSSKEKNLLSQLKTL